MPNESSPPTTSAQEGFHREFVVGEAERWPTLSDFAYVSYVNNYFIHSAFQTEAPAPGATGGPVKSRLVARLAYTEAHYLELLETLMRQYVASQRLHGEQASGAAILALRAALDRAS